MKKLIKFAVAAAICAVVAWLFLWTITPFDELEGEHVAAVEISTEGVKLDEVYAAKVLKAITPIRLYGQSPFWTEWRGWNDGSRPYMFYLVLSDGTRISVGENYPYFVIDGKQYRLTPGSKKYLYGMQDLYFAHPDHASCG